MDAREDATTATATRRTVGVGLMRILVALFLAVPVGTLLWFELLYLAFGLTGNDAGPVASTLAALGAYGVAFAVPLAGGGRLAAVVSRGCRLGILAAALLPAVAVVVLMLWQHSEGRRDLGMGGLMLYNAPLVAFVISLVLIVAFWAGHAAARRRLVGPPTGEA